MSGLYTKMTFSFVYSMNSYIKAIFLKNSRITKKLKLATRIDTIQSMFYVFNSDGIAVFKASISFKKLISYICSYNIDVLWRPKTLGIHFVEKYVPHSMPIFKKISSDTSSGRSQPLPCFLCNDRITYIKNQGKV